ncbi:MAG TPA: AsnC family transcriptional regulator [Phenylobacterium sp.]
MTPIAIDEIDEQIIALLSKEGRASNRSIGRDLNLSEGAVRKRLRRLLEAEAISYGLLVDIEVTGLQSFGWLYLCVEPRHAKAMLTYVAHLDVCSLVTRTTGEFNIAAYLYNRTDASMAETIQVIGQQAGVTKSRFRKAISHPAHRYGYVALADVGAPTFWHLVDVDGGPAVDK